MQINNSATQHMMMFASRDLTLCGQNCPQVRGTLEYKLRNTKPKLPGHHWCRHAAISVSNKIMLNHMRTLMLLYIHLFGLSLNEGYVEGSSIWLLGQVSACMAPKAIAPTVAPQTVSPQTVAPRL